MKEENIFLGAMSITIAVIIIACALLPAVFSPAAEAAIFNVLPIAVISGLVMIGLYIFINHKDWVQSQLTLRWWKNENK